MRRYSSVHDDFAGFWDWLNWSEPTFTMIRGQIYDPETHYLMPKESYKKTMLEQKEKRLLAIKEHRQREESRLKEEENTLQLEIDELKKSLTPEKTGNMTEELEKFKEKQRLIYQLALENRKIAIETALHRLSPSGSYAVQTKGYLDVEGLIEDAKKIEEYLTGSMPF